MRRDASYRFSTRAVHAGQSPDESTGAVMPPIYASSTFAQSTPGNHRGYEYARTGNPTRSALEDNIASLENARHGRAYASGMGAIDAVCSLLSPGDHVVTGADIYAGTHRIFTRVYERYGIEFSFVDMTDPNAIDAACRSETALVWLETPTNPLLRIVDLDAAVDVAREADAWCAVDNTFATPSLQRPLDHGADLVCHSLTKYLGGHSDIVGGAVLTNDAELDDRLGFHQNSVGAVPSPFDCFLVLRGTKTLPLRMARHCENARAVARWLDEHPAVATVYYPGLSSHEGHEIAAAQMADSGGMVSFELDGPKDVASDVVSSTTVFTLAESLGGVESLIEQPAAMTHAGLQRERRIAAGLTDGLIRLSVGIEHQDDLIDDLGRAIDSSVG